MLLIISILASVLIGILSGIKSIKNEEKRQNLYEMQSDAEKRMQKCIHGYKKARLQAKFVCGKAIVTGVIR